MITRPGDERAGNADDDGLVHLRERRSFPRLRAEVPIVAVVTRARELPTGTRVPGRLIDLSPAGMSFVPAAPLQPGDLVRIAFGGAAAAVVPDAVVMRATAGADGRPICACRFSELQPWLVAHVAASLDAA